MHRQLETVLVAEALTRLPDGRARLLEDHRAMAIALQDAGEAPAARLLTWIRHLRCHDALVERIGRQLALIRQLATTLCLLGLIIGWMAASSPLGAGGTVNIAFLLASLVAVPTLLLILWLLLLAASRVLPGRRSGGGLLARLPLQLAALPWRRSDPEGRATLAGTLRVLGTPPAGPWFFSSITHGFWLAFAVGASLSLTLRLITQQYDFVWGTTLISEQRAASVLLALTWLPQQLGLTVPDAAVLEASRQGSPEAGAHRRLWAGFALICVLLYVLIPRLLLAALSLQLTRRALAGLQPDQSEPLLQRALLQLRQASQPAAPPATRPAEALQPVTPVTETAPGSADYFVCVGVELDPDDPDWPPEPDHWQVLCLDPVQGRRSARQALAQLDALEPRPAGLLLVTSLARTPDRGLVDLLCELANKAQVPARVWLLESETDRQMAERPDAGSAVAGNPVAGNPVAGNPAAGAATTATAEAEPSREQVWQQRLQAGGFTRIERGSWQDLRARSQASLTRTDTQP